MRMRKKKHGSDRLDACASFLTSEGVRTPVSSPVYVEIGAGKGGFACEMAERHPDALYFAMERVSDCVVLAAERAKERQEKDGSLENLRFLVDTADNLMRLFGRETVDHIFLNFSDPWTKKGYAKRRLMHRRYLAVYLNLLRDGGKVTFKTDNTALFDFALEEIAAMGIAPDYVTRDLHASERAADNVVTEYEKNFTEQGMKIHMVEFSKPAGCMPELAPELTPEGRTLDDQRHHRKSENA